MSGSISEYFDVGAALGKGIARSRFNRGVSQLETEYGVADDGQLSDPNKEAEYEQRVRALARDKGVTRRGMTDDSTYLQEFRDNLTRDMQRQQAAAAGQGNYQQVHQLDSQLGFRAGDTQRGLQGAYGAQDAATATQHQNDPMALAKARRENAAGRGDMSQMGDMENKLIQLAQQQLSAVMMQVKSGQAIDSDTLVGKINGVLTVPGHPWQGYNLRETTTDNMYQLVDREGNALGEPLDQQGVITQMGNFLQDPTAAYRSLREAELAEAKERKDTARERGKAAFDSRLKIIETLAPKLGEAASVVVSKVEASRDAGAKAGIKYTSAPQTVGDKTVLFASYNGQPVVIEMVNDEESPNFGKPLFKDDKGNQIQFKGDDPAALQTSIMAAAEVARMNFDNQTRAMVFSLQAVDAIEGGRALNSPSSGTGGSRGGQGARGDRNNNPGNIRKGKDQWQGATGDDGEFVQFETPEAGVRAAAKVLNTYATQHKLNTVEGIVNRWAPPNENDTGAYVATVAKALGVAPNAPLDMQDPKTIEALLAAQFKIENGYLPVNPEQLRAGVAMAFGGQPPTSAGKAVGSVATAPTKDTAAGKVEPAGSAPALRRSAATAEAAATRVREAKAALDAFDRKHTGGALQRGGKAITSSISDPAKRQVRERLARELDEATAAANAVATTTKRQVASADVERRGRAMYDEAHAAGRSGKQ